MKKIAVPSFLLCLVMLAQLLLTPVSATETTETTSAAASAETTAVTDETAQIPFGRVSIDNGCRTINGLRPLIGSDRRLDTAQAVFAFETNTETVVYSYNPDAKMSPGTLTKVVAALVAIENSNLEDVVTCSEGIQSKVPGSSLKLSPKLKSGEQLSVSDLVHGVLMVNANDATVALAEHVAGTTTAFLELMNARVRQMGCTSTEFGNISGLDTATSYTTAREMAKIVLEATKNETFAEIFGTTQYIISPTNLVEEERELNNNNYMIWDKEITQFKNKWVTGGIASSTENSGASIVCTAEDSGMRYVCVVLGATRVMNSEASWKVDTYGNFEEMTSLVNYLIKNFKINRIVYDGMSVNQWPVSGGECDVVGQSFTDVDTVVPAGVQMKNFVTNFSVKDGGFTAPIGKDDVIATVEYWYLNSCVAEVELHAMAGVRAIGDTGVSIRGNGVEGSSGGTNAMSVIGTVCVIILGVVGAYLAFNSYMRQRRRAQRRRRREDRRRSR